MRCASNSTLNVGWGEDSVITLTHEPNWLLDWYWNDVSGKNFSHFICDYLKGRCKLRIAGTCIIIRVLHMYLQMVQVMCSIYLWMVVVGHFYIWPCIWQLQEILWSYLWDRLLPSFEILAGYMTRLYLAPSINLLWAVMQALTFIWLRCRLLWGIQRYSLTKCIVLWSCLMSYWVLRYEILASMLI